MIKRITFRAALGGVLHDDVVGAWEDAMGAWSAAPIRRRPARVASCEVLHDEAGTDRRFDVVELVWCDDREHLTRCVEWAADVDLYRSLDGLVDPTRTCILFAEEVVARGADWLGARWCHGGAKLKHMAVAQRASGLTPAEFSARWRSRAGRVRRSGTETTIDIPDAVRGLAYVQNHDAGDGELVSDVDAVNEVYFDDRAGLRARIEWFAEQLADGEDDLVGEHWFIAASETVVLDDRDNTTGGPIT